MYTGSLDKKDKFEGGSEKTVSVRAEADKDWLSTHDDALSNQWRHQFSFAFPFSFIPCKILLRCNAKFTEILQSKKTVIDKSTCLTAATVWLVKSQAGGRLSGGRLFQRRLPATGNARSPTVDRSVCRSTSCEDDDDRRWQWFESAMRQIMQASVNKDVQHEVMFIFPILFSNVLFDVLFGCPVSVALKSSPYGLSANNVIALFQLWPQTYTYISRYRTSHRRRVKLCSHW